MTNTPKSQNPKWLGTVLMTSVALNLFMGGFIASRYVAQQQPRVPSPAVVVDTPPVAALDFRVLPDGVPLNVQENIEKAVRKHTREVERSYRDYARQQRQINRLLSQENVDEDELRAAFAELQAIQERLQGPIYESLALALSRMDLASREMMIVNRENELPLQIIGPEVTAGKNWRFEMKDGKFTIDMEKLKRLKRLKEVEIERVRNEVERVKEEMKQKQKENFDDWLEDDRRQRERHDPNLR